MPVLVCAEGIALDWILMSLRLSGFSCLIRKIKDHFSFICCNLFYNQFGNRIVRGLDADFLNP